MKMPPKIDWVRHSAPIVKMWEKEEIRISCEW